MVGSLFRRTKIVCTLGPASASLKAIRSIIDAGADAVRLNFSHGDHAFHDDLIQKVRRVSAEKARPIPIIQDLQGPRFRVGDLEEGYLDLKRGMTVTIGGMRSGRGLVPVRPAGAMRGVKVGHRVTIGDMGVSLKVKSRTRTRASAKVVRGGTIQPGKGIGFPDSKSTLPTLTEKDLRDLRFGIRRGVDFIALSFVRDASDITELRRYLRRSEIGVISKIETREAVSDIDDIIDASDAVLVARGDLASEVSISRLPIIQKLLIEKCNHKAKPVITATQMLESMIEKPQPTRAEASDVANAVLDGTDAVMLSGETAIGEFPVAVVRMMASLVSKTERARVDAFIRRNVPIEPEPELDETIAYLAADAAQRLGAAAIIPSTRSGITARRVAKFRPDVPVLAVTPSPETRMRLALSHGVMCEQIEEATDTDGMIAGAIEAARSKGIVKKGDLVVVTAGVPPWVTGKTNLLKLEVV